MAVRPSYEQLEQRVRALEQQAVERDRTANAVQESEIQLRTLFENSLNPIMAVDEQGRYVDANPAALEFLECDREALLGKTVWDFAAPGDLEQVQQEHSPFVSRRTLETQYLVRGKKKTLLLNVVPLVLSDKTILYGIGQDITELKQVGEALRESEERFRRAFDHAAVGMVLVSVKGRFLKVNPYFCQMIGYSEDELLSKEFNDVTHPDDRHIGMEILRGVVDGKIPSGVAAKRYLHKDGRIVWGMLSTSAVRDAAGKALYFVSHIQDITERTKAAKALEQKEKRLEHQARHLAKVNTALKVLLDHREEEKKQLEGSVLTNVRKLILPYVEKLEKTDLDGDSQTYVSIIKSNLTDFLSPFANTLSSKYADFTPTEIQIADLIKQGKTSKDIALLLSISCDTVSFHRRNIRKKLGLLHKKKNLTSYLLSLKS